MKTTTPEKAERIELGSDRMIEAWKQGLEWYQPTFSGHKLHEEGGVTQVSLENLEDLTDDLGPATRVIIGPNQGVLVRWGHELGPIGECYLATGFSISYRGEGPAGFARFLESQDVGDYGEILNLLAVLDEKFEGLLFERDGKGFITKHLMLPPEE